jgi:hypothetical protein
MLTLLVHLPFLYFGTVVFAAIYIGVARRRRPKRRPRHRRDKGGFDE